MKSTRSPACRRSGKQHGSDRVSVQRRHRPLVLSRTAQVPPITDPGVRPQGMTPRAQTTVYDNQQRPENQWVMSPDVDGCEPADLTAARPSLTSEEVNRREPDVLLRKRAEGPAADGGGPRRGETNCAGRAGRNTTAPDCDDGAVAIPLIFWAAGAAGLAAWGWALWAVGELVLSR